MRLTTILLTVCCVHAAAKGVSQKLTVSVKEAPLEQVFEEITRQTGYVFFFKPADLKDLRPVSASVINYPFADFLSLVLRDQPVKYTVKNKTVVVKRVNGGKDFKFSAISPRSMLENPPITVRGRIVNENGEPVVASVIVKGTNKGTSSNINGEFVLNDVNADADLIVSATNIETTFININNRTNLSITAKTTASSLNEVVVNKGYYSEKKKLSTGNVSLVAAKEIEKNPISNPLQAMQGRVAGLEIVQQSGVPGSNFQVRLRGQNSIANGNDPLYIIDGVPFTSTSMALSETSGNLLFAGTSPLNYINPSDISGIEVLKDADAIAIYGSRGANGVILITTKKGKPGDTKIDFNAYTGMGKVSNTVPLLHTPEYIKIRKEAFENDGITTYPDNAYDINGSWDENRYTDWQNDLIGGTAKYYDGQLGFSGGTVNTQYIIGAGYHRESTVFPGKNADDRSSLHFNINNSSDNKKFKISLSGSYSALHASLLRQDLTLDAISLAPNAPSLYSSSGDINWEDNAWDNPIAYIKKRYDAKTNNLTGNLLLQYRLLNNLEFKSSFGYTNIEMNAISTEPISSRQPKPGLLNASTFSNSKFNNWIIEPQLNWNKNIGKGILNALIGSTFMKQETNGSAETAEGFSSESLMRNINAATKRTPGTNYSNQYKYNALFGRINYTYDQKYIINITGRRDGSSRFGPGRQFANFGAIGAAWVLTEEKFIKNNSSFLSFAKLRASYGTSGNDQLGDYEYLNVYRPGDIYQTTVGLSPVRLENPDFAWEMNKKFETGVELAFYNNQFRILANYYLNRSSNQLVGFPLPPTAGFPTVNGNLPAKVQNSGLELELNSENIKGKNFSWESSLNLSVPRNKLLEYPDLENSVYASQYVIGQSLKIRKLYHFTGIDQNTGLFSFEDANQDDLYNTLDRTSIRLVGTNFFGGFGNSFSYKQIQLSFLIQFVKQTSTYGRSIFGTPPGGYSNQPSYLFAESDGKYVEDMQKLSLTSEAVSAYSRFLSSDAVVSDASFIRLKNFSLSYNFPTSFINKIKISGMRVYLQCQNLFTITNFKGLDPEWGLTLPPLRVITGGINLTL